MPLPLNGDNTPSFISELLYRLKVRDVMTRSLFTVNKDHCLRDAQNLMKQNTITGVPVVEGHRLLGIVSMDDIIRALDLGNIDHKVDKHMTRNVTVLEDDMPLAFALSYMEKYHFGRFPVLDKTGELVGIITSRDIILHLLIAMNHEMEIMEEKLKVPESPEQTQVAEPTIGIVKKEFVNRKFDFENAGRPSSEIKKLCVAAKVDSKTIRRIAVASYELEMNQVIHSNGGSIAFEMGPSQARLIAADCGPGIEDLEAALREGFSTATEWVRSLGFGAGMGLPNTKRVSDSFSIESSLPKGTTVTCSFNLSPRGEQDVS